MMAHRSRMLIADGKLTLSDLAICNGYSVVLV